MVPLMCSPLVVSSEHVSTTITLAFALLQVPIRRRQGARGGSAVQVVHMHQALNVARLCMSTGERSPCENLKRLRPVLSAAPVMCWLAATLPFRILIYDSAIAEVAFKRVVDLSVECCGSSIVSSAFGRS